jgi:hypothetical protein
MSATLPCMRDDTTGDDIGPSDETLFLWAIGLAEERGFNWLSIAPEDRGDWARRVMAWEAEHGSDER